MGSGEGLCPPQLGVWGLAPRNKINFALKLCNSEQVLVLLSYIPAESVGGGLSPVLKVGDLSPCPRPCSDAYECVTQLHFRGNQVTTEGREVEVAESFLFCGSLIHCTGGIVNRK